MSRSFVICDIVKILFEIKSVAMLKKVLEQAKQIKASCTKAKLRELGPGDYSLVSIVGMLQSCTNSERIARVCSYAQYQWLAEE